MVDGRAKEQPVVVPDKSHRSEHDKTEDLRADREWNVESGDEILMRSNSCVDLRHR
jgi:hypothetical protein